MLSPCPDRLSAQGEAGGTVCGVVREHRAICPICAVSAFWFLFGSVRDNRALGKHKPARCRSLEIGGLESFKKCLLQNRGDGSCRGASALIGCAGNCVTRRQPR